MVIPDTVLGIPRKSFQHSDLCRRGLGGTGGFRELLEGWEEVLHEQDCPHLAAAEVRGGGDAMTGAFKAC